VTPSHHQSGTSVKHKTKISKMGKAVVRGELHMPALNAMRTNPILRTFAQRLRADGRPEAVIICAVVRKLIHICYGVLKHKKPFDPNYGNALSTA
jgi:transposase